MSRRPKQAAACWLVELGGTVMNRLVPLRIWGPSGGTPELLVRKQGFDPVDALMVGTQGHTRPQQLGKVMSLVKPRLAIGYHFYNDFDAEPIFKK